MPCSERVVANVILSVTIVLTTGCASRPASFPGRGQAVAFQTALRDCFARNGIAYEPIVEPPGSTHPLVPAPVPYEWWAGHGGYGLIDDQSGEVELDPSWVDPNHAVAERASNARWTRVLYGQAGSSEHFEEGSCYDDALRRAGFLAESRLGTLPEPTTEQVRDAATAADVVGAQQRHEECLIDAGISPELRSDPEGALRHRFIERGLIVTDAVHTRHASASGLRSARDLEERVALADIQCRRKVGVDRAVDAALRRGLGGEGG